MLDTVDFVDVHTIRNWEVKLDTCIILRLALIAADFKPQDGIVLGIVTNPDVRIFADWAAVGRCIVECIGHNVVRILKFYAGDGEGF